MGAATGIEWCHMTFNPWTGCQHVSPGCDHCYAEAQAKRNASTFGGWGPHAARKRTSESYWRQPLKWNSEARKAGTRPRVFCASMADVFDNRVSEDWRADLWTLIAQTSHLDWLLLTKRPQNIAAMLPVTNPDRPGYRPWNIRWPEGWPNVWLGTTVENREEMLRRGPALMTIPAANHFWSAEPLLGDLGMIPREIMPSWVICGGESGPGARPMHPDWARSLRDQCAAAGVPFFFKQHGEWAPAPWKLKREEGENDEAYKARSDAEGASHAISFAGYSQKLSHKPWSIERDCERPPGYYGIRWAGKKAAGRLLEGELHDAVPA